MTSEIEKVARAIFGDSCAMSEAQIVAARAAILAFLECLEEPSEEMLDSADDPFHDEWRSQREWCEFHNKPVSFASGTFSQRIWQAMLRQKWKEIGGG